MQAHFLLGELARVQGDGLAAAAHFEAALAQDGLRTLEWASAKAALARLAKGQGR